MPPDNTGDCSIYISYDTTLLEAAMSWFKIAEFVNCNQLTGKENSIAIPGWLRSCSHCVLRWEYYSIVPDKTKPEFFANCIDVVIKGHPAGGTLGIPRVKVPDHLPADNPEKSGRYSVVAPRTITGPVLAQPEEPIPETQPPTSIPAGNSGTPAPSPGPPTDTSGASTPAPSHVSSSASKKDDKKAVKLSTTTILILSGCALGVLTFAVLVGVIWHRKRQMQYQQMQIELLGGSGYNKPKKGDYSL
jgi:hypothetical protein